MATSDATQTYPTSAALLTHLLKDQDPQDGALWYKDNAALERAITQKVQANTTRYETLLMQNSTYSRLSANSGRSEEAAHELSLLRREGYRYLATREISGEIGPSYDDTATRLRTASNARFHRNEGRIATISGLLDPETRGDTVVDEKRLATELAGLRKEQTLLARTNTSMFGVVDGDYFGSSDDHNQLTRYFADHSNGLVGGRLQQFQRNLVGRMPGFLDLTWGFERHGLLGDAASVNTRLAVADMLTPKASGNISSAEQDYINRFRNVANQDRDPVSKSMDNGVLADMAEYMRTHDVKFTKLADGRVQPVNAADQKALMGMIQEFSPELKAKLAPHPQGQLIADAGHGVHNTGGTQPRGRA